MFEIGIKADFSAAHRLDGYQGPCSDFHGHNWGVEVFVRGEELDDTGILMDFKLLKQHVSEVLQAVDHRDLNSLEEFRQANPSSENIARLLYREVSSRLNCDRYRVHRVSVRETRGSIGTYWE